MAKFIKPAIEIVHREYIGKHTNNPINIDLCTEIVKKDEHDGYGNTYPVIFFKGNDVTWYYNKDVFTRDMQYDEILLFFQ